MKCSVTVKTTSDHRFHAISALISAASSEKMDRYTKLGTTSGTMNIHQQSSPLGDHKYRGDPRQSVVQEESHREEIGQIQNTKEPERFAPEQHQSDYELEVGDYIGAIYEKDHKPYIVKIIINHTLLKSLK